VSRERALARRLRTLATLDEVIGALRSLSAQHFRAARAALADARAYRGELCGLLGIPERSESGTQPPVGLVLIGAELGLVGDYTSRLVREALALREEWGPGPVVCVGRRAAVALRKAGIEPTSLLPCPASAAGLTGLLLPLVDTLLGLHADGALASLWLVAARFEGAGRFSPARVPLLPVPAANPDSEPRLSRYAEPESLRAIALREYLYASLYETFLEALASEHGVRLVRAESARTWLARRIDATRRLGASIRREVSTQEVLEVAAAARAARRHA